MKMEYASLILDLNSLEAEALARCEARREARPEGRS
jgi:hypothetical protein